MNEDAKLEDVPRLIRDRDALIKVRNAFDARMAKVKTEEEKREIDALVMRWSTPKCSFDRKHKSILFGLVIGPDRVSLYWRLRERWHRFIHHH